MTTSLFLPAPAPTVTPSGLDLSKLDYEQRLAVTAPVNTPAIVVAAAGSGKTRVLTHRVAYLTLEKKFIPASIVCTTFTTKAADEMRSRLIPLIGEQRAKALYLGTIHALCLRLLRETDGKFSVTTPGGRTVPLGPAPLAPDYLLRSKVSAQFGSLKKGGAGWKKMPKGWASWWVRRAKTHLVWPEQSKEWFVKQIETLSPRDTWDVPADLDTLGHHLSQIFTNYQQELTNRGEIDFDDMLIRVRLGLNEVPGFAEMWSRQFRAVLVDEVQDTNSLSLGILETLAAKHGGLFMVGDNDQSLYGWNGATPIENVFGFQKRHMLGRIYKLSTNYRSTRAIVEASGRVIRSNYELDGSGELDPERAPFWKDVKPAPDAKPGNPITYSLVKDDDVAMEEVLDEIESAVRNGARSPKDFAVISRTNRALAIYERECIARKLPYTIRGGTPIYERAEFKDLLAFCRVLNADNPANVDDDSLFRIWNIPSAYFTRTSSGATTHFFGAAFKAKIQAIQKEQGASSAFAALKAAVSGGHLLDREARAAKDLLQTIDLTRGVPGTPLHAQISAYLDSCYTSWFLSERSDKSSTDGIDGDTDKEALEALRVVTGYMSPFRNVGALMQHVILARDMQAKAAQGKVDAITLSTVHGAKGLEWHTVYGIGLTDGIMPHAKAGLSVIDDLARTPDDRDIMLPLPGLSTLEDETCTAYVMVSRAAVRLHLLVSARKPSPYLFQIIPDEKEHAQILETSQAAWEEWRAEHGQN